MGECFRCRQNGHKGRECNMIPDPANLKMGNAEKVGFKNVVHASTGPASHMSNKFL